MNYIGSKHTLLDWLSESILNKTGWTSFQGKRIADLFAGTGVVSMFFRNQGATVLSNDIEPCSSCVSKAMTEGVFTSSVKAYIDRLNAELEAGAYKQTIGFLTTNYSPCNGCERMFFTVDNAQRMDYCRRHIEDAPLPEAEKNFVLASLLVSADAVANCASVYGAYLKAFKTTAKKELVLTPLHTCTTPTESQSFSSDVLEESFLTKLSCDLAYLDPPYNARQYSKNYFPLSVLALPPDEQEGLALSGKTGIPSTCFTSSFCSTKTVNQSFETLLSTLKAKWVFISYNSESLLDKDTLVELMKTHGTVTVLEKDYKRFKSQQKGKKQIKEYLFCLERV